MKTLDFCYDWRFHKGDVQNAMMESCADADWTSITVPHTWNADDMYPGRPMAEAYVGPAWYRKHFRLERPADGGRVFLVFEAIANTSEVWVDGSYVGGRDGGFLAFRLDITEALADGDAHVVAVRADNSPRTDSIPPHPIDWERYGGVYRPVWLASGGAAHFDFKGVRIATPHVSAEWASVHIRAAVRDTVHRNGPLTLRHRLLDAAGDEVASIETPVETRIGLTWRDARFDRIPQPRLWSVGEPNLYRVVSELIDGDTTIDRQVNPLGFRWFRFDPEEGFSLNGVPLKLCGVNAHQDYPGLGFACPDRFHRREVEMMKAAGMNFLRASHYPRNERVLDACDELGLLVMEEQPFWHGSLRAQGGERLLDRGRRLMQDLVGQHGNHPCILGWSTVNEIMLTLNPNEAHPDPRQRTPFHALPPKEWAYAKRGVETLNTALREADPSRPTCVVIGGWWRENVQAGITDLGDLVGYNGGTMHGTIDGEPVYDVLHRQKPRWVALMSEGILNDGPPGRANWDAELRFWRTCARHWSNLYQRRWFCGGAMWVWADYSAKGVYRTRGCLDDARIPYESYWFFQSQWAARPMVHICGHWSWNNQPGESRQVAVFSNCPRVTLALNGRDLGEGESTALEYPGLPHAPRLWQVPWEPGCLEAAGHSHDGLVTDRRHTEGPPAQLTLQADTPTLLADGKDVCFLEVVGKDRAGQRCFNLEASVQIEVQGSATLAGPPRRDLRGGTCGFAIRSNGQAGPVVVSARLDGLEPAQVELTAVSFAPPCP